MTWYREKPELLAETAAEVTAAQPLLTMVDRGDVVVFAGTYEIKQGGILLDVFEIEVEPSPTMPRDMPIVRETAGKIPRVLDPHHVVDKEGMLCVALPDWYWYHYPKGLSLAEYLEGPLRAHLAGQALVLAGDPWPADEWAHGNPGRMQFYEQELGTTDPLKLFQMLFAAACEKLRGDQRCPCGSKRRLLVCHRKLLDMKKRIPRDTLLKASGLFNDKRKERRSA